MYVMTVTMTAAKTIIAKIRIFHQRSQTLLPMAKSKRQTEKPRKLHLLLAKTILSCISFIVSSFVLLFSCRSHVTKRNPPRQDRKGELPISCESLCKFASRISIRAHSTTSSCTQILRLAVYDKVLSHAECTYY